MKYFLLLFTTLFFGQNKDLGKVSLSELKEKHHAIDSSASAAYIFKTGTSKFILNGVGVWSVITDVSIKIKIYKKEGLKYANYEVPYYVGGNLNEGVVFSKACTYNLEGNEIVKTKLDSDGEFKEQTNKKWRTRKITLPAVKVGSVIEFSYKHISTYFTKIEDWEFQSDIPVDYVEYFIYIPEYLRYRTIITGSDYVAVERDVKIISTGNFGEVKYGFKSKNVPAVKVENYVFDIENSKSVLKNEIATISYPKRPVQNYSLDWEGVANSILDDDDFGGQLNQTKFLEDDLEQLKNMPISYEKKTDSILAFFQNKISWNGEYGYLTNKGVKKAYLEKSGNAAEININLINGLNYLGIKAYPVLVSTRGNGIVAYPSRYGFNYLVVAAFVDGNYILLDAADKLTSKNLLPLKALSWKGRLIKNKTETAEIFLENVNKSNKNITGQFIINENGKLEGKIRNQLFDYFAYDYRKRGYLKNDQFSIESIERDFPSLKINEYVVQNKNELNKPLIETYTLNHNNITEIIGSRIYFSPMLMFQTTENPFKSSERFYPIDFNFPLKESYSLLIDIPDGFEIESLPESVNISSENDFLAFKMTVLKKEKLIHVIASFEINTAFVPAKSHESLKDFYKEMIKKQSEKIVLKKK
jgi:hypothetical protein